MTDYNHIIESYNSAEMVVIGLGSELARKKFESDESRLSVLDFYNKILDRKNYFIITSHKNNIFDGSGFNERRIVNPFADDTGDNEKQWDLYNKWLSATLNKRLLIIELGEDFNQPNVFRWPFERIVAINQKSFMYRVNSTFYQLPAELGDRAKSIKCDAAEFITGLKDYMNDNCV